MFQLSLCNIQSISQSLYENALFKKWKQKIAIHSVFFIFISPYFGNETGFQMNRFLFLLSFRFSIYAKCMIGHEI